MKRIIVIIMVVALLIVCVTTHTQVVAEQSNRNIIGFCKCLADDDPYLFQQWFGTLGACVRTFKTDPVTWWDICCVFCLEDSGPCWDCRVEYDIKCKCILP